MPQVDSHFSCLVGLGVGVLSQPRVCASNHGQGTYGMCVLRQKRARTLRATKDQ